MTRFAPATAPWLIRTFPRRIIDNEPIVSGRYGTYDSDESDAVRAGTATLVQAGREIRLHVTRQINRRKQTQDKPSNFTYSGRFQAGQLVALFFDDGAKYRTGAIVLRYDSARRRFTGRTMYYDAPDGVVSFFFEMRFVKPL